MIALTGKIKMKFILSTNYKLAFKLLNEDKELATWIDQSQVGKAYKFRGSIAICGGDHVNRYLPTIYDAFEVDCKRFNIEFLILENDVEQDAIDRARNSPPKSIDDLRRLMGTEVQVKVNE